MLSRAATDVVPYHPVKLTLAPSATVPTHVAAVDYVDPSSRMVTASSLPPFSPARVSGKTPLLTPADGKIG